MLPSPLVSTKSSVCFSVKTVAMSAFPLGPFQDECLKQNFPVSRSPGHRVASFLLRGLVSQGSGRSPAQSGPGPEEEQTVSKGAECLAPKLAPFLCLGPRMALKFQWRQVPHAQDPTLAEESAWAACRRVPSPHLNSPCVSPRRRLADQAGLLLHRAAQSRQSEVLRPLGQGEPPAPRVAAVGSPGQLEAPHWVSVSVCVSALAQVSVSVCRPLLLAHVRVASWKLLVLMLLPASQPSSPSPTCPCSLGSTFPPSPEALPAPCSASTLPGIGIKSPSDFRVDGARQHCWVGAQGPISSCPTHPPCSLHSPAP